MSVSPVEDSLLPRFRELVAEDLRLLALLQEREPDWNLLSKLREHRFSENLGIRLKSEAGRQAHELLDNFLAQLPAAPEQRLLDELAADFAAIYLTHHYRASPCESVWLDEEGLVCQAAMFQIREWYRKYGLAAENWRVRSDDHLVLQLVFLAHLFDLESEPDILLQAIRFMDEHPLRWVEQFATRVAARCSTPYYAGLALLTAAYVEELRDLLAALLDAPRPSAEEIEQRLSADEKPAEAPLRYMPGMAPSW